MLLKLYSNDAQREDTKWLLVLNQMIYTLVGLSHSQQIKIQTFRTETEGVEFILSHLNSLHAGQTSPIRKIVHALKIQNDCGYLPYNRRKKLKPISIPK